MSKYALCLLIESNILSPFLFDWFFVEQDCKEGYQERWSEGAASQSSW
jgi:hypothetical protein